MPIEPIKHHPVLKSNCFCIEMKQLFRDKKQRNNCTKPAVYDDKNLT